jgi:glucosyl-3-phosphoglycerate synthase
MGDFYQNGLVTTLTDMKTRPYEDYEVELLKFSKVRPMGLIIPSLYSELAGKALRHILDELEKVPYLSEVVIGLDRATEDEYKHAKEYFSRLPMHHRILWNDGPRLTALHEKLLSQNIAPEQLGKGRNAWYCFGYIIASGKTEAVALHDADILTYNRGMLAKLLYPVANPNFNYRFCKGFYFRSNADRIHGRVVRLLVTPLLRTLKKFFGPLDYLEFLDSFRYPLAGEFSMRSDVLKTIRIPSDWGLEVGILSEVHRNNSTNRICQVEIADRYDHKHQPVSPNDPDKGLSRMVHDIAMALFIKLAQNGAVFSQGMFRSIRSTYFRIGLDFVEQYSALAAINGLDYNRHQEEETIDLFAKIVHKAGEDMLGSSNHTVFIPSWKRIMSAYPDFLDEFYEAVEQDNK